MGMGESGDEKPQITSQPRWPLDAVSYRTLVDSFNASANGHYAESLPGKNSTNVMEPADRSISGVNDMNEFWPDAQHNVFGH